MITMNTRTKKGSSSHHENGSDIRLINSIHENGARLDPCRNDGWNHPLVVSMPEPTRMFSFLCITVMIIRYGYGHDWNFTDAMTTGFFLNPYLCLFITMATAAIYYGYKTRPKGCKPLAVYDRWIAEWYWWNGWLFHMVMDGASGSFRLIPVVVYQYDRLDLRFPDRHVVPWIVGAIELFIMGPLCMITAAAVIQRNRNRFALELITSTLHITGMIIFVASEVYEGQLNVPALDPVGIPGHPWANIKFDVYHLIHYWFGFWFCNLVWGIVPLIRIKRAIIECNNAFKAMDAITTPISNKSS
jgi:EXPERA (EXPanded EBP superfamily)